MLSTRQVAKGVGVTPRAIYYWLRDKGHFWGVTPQRPPIDDDQPIPWMWPDDAIDQIRAARRAAGRGVQHD
jgi:hypothetical protein